MVGNERREIRLRECLGVGSADAKGWSSDGLVGQTRGSGPCKQMAVVEEDDDVQKLGL